VDVELAFNSLVENPVTGPALSLPRQGDTPMSPLLQSIASLEEALQAQIRELDHDLREAFSRLADADFRISQMEAESTRLRDIEVTAAKALSQCAAVEARLAAVERLTPTSVLQRNPPSRLPRWATRSRDVLDPQISLGSWLTLRGNAERSAPASGINYAARRGSTR
jgi:hypothetical protein